VALDAELKREVALKQILEQYADDPFSRQRFVAEAEITGGLEHPASFRSMARGNLERVPARDSCRTCPKLSFLTRT